MVLSGHLNSSVGTCGISAHVPPNYPVLQSHGHRCQIIDWQKQPPLAIQSATIVVVQSAADPQIQPVSIRVRPKPILQLQGLIGFALKPSCWMSRFVSLSRRYRKFADSIDSLLQSRRFSGGPAGLLQVPKVTKIPIQPDVMDLRVPDDWPKTSNGATV